MEDSDDASFPSDLEAPLAPVAVAAATVKRKRDRTGQTSGCARKKQKREAAAIAPTVFLARRMDDKLMVFFHATLRSVKAADLLLPREPPESCTHLQEQLRSWPKLQLSDAIVWEFDINFRFDGDDKAWPVPVTSVLKLNGVATFRKQPIGPADLDVVELHRTMNIPLGSARVFYL